MLRLTVSILITCILLSVILQHADSSASLTRVTHTSEHALNLNPSLSDDGKVVVFESTADLSETGQNSSFHAIRADVSTGISFNELARSRIVSPSLSSDGKAIVFASTDDLAGRNADRNSEIFLFTDSRLTQLTVTQPSSSVSRLSQGSFQPSITPDGAVVAFVSNQDLVGINPDLSSEIFLYRRSDESFVQLTNTATEEVMSGPKISAGGSRVYYKRAYANGTADLMLFETASGTSRIVAAEVVDLTIAEGRVVSNDGMRLVYSVSTGSNQTQVFMFDARDNSIRQLTQLGSRATDVKLQATISGDGRRVAFATRRRVVNASDGGVELYLLDLPSGELQQITNAPSGATAEVVSSLNFDGSLVAFSFPRIISGPVSDDDLRNNSEVYLAVLPPRAVGAATVVNAAAHGNEPQPSLIAPGSIASIRGTSLALKTLQAEIDGNELPFEVAGTTVTVKGQPARMFYVSPNEVQFVVPSLASGPAEFLVTNQDGLSSRAEALISSAAPGIFTIAGDGRGEAVILNSDTLARGPFDPSSGQLRLSLFVTGVSEAGNVSVEINGSAAIVEAVEPARLPGLDEIHILVPAALRGTGTSTLVVTADGVRSNPVSVVIGGLAPTPTPTPTPTPLPTPSPSPSPSPSPTPAPGPPTGIVISQIFGGGGNAGAPFRNDYIEIFNAGNTAVDLTGWSVQYASATATTWSITPLTGVMLEPGRYYLIQQSSGGSNGITLPAPEASGTIAMAAASGKVAIVRNATALSGACPSNTNIVDLLGYGNANCFRGSAPAAATSNTTALLRVGAGCTVTQINSADFSLGAPNPRNSQTPRVTCGSIASRNGAKMQSDLESTIFLLRLSASAREILLEWLTKNPIAHFAKKQLDSHMHSLTDAVASLRKHFGFEDFREGQREVVGSILEGKDAVVVMPTGSGKSLCYQLPAMILDGVTLVVSPLIALMKDQVDALQARGLPATFINSSISDSEQHARIDSLRRREHKLVYIAPERFRSSRFNAALQQIPISLVAVDEAHCISTWGHDFRPDYLRLRNVIKSLGKVQTLALTATATPYVRSDIIQQLGLDKPQTFVSGFDRPNLSIEVIHTEKEREKMARIRNLARAIPGSGIIYASTRKAVEQVGAKLKALDLGVSVYHAGMSDGVRIKAQEDFMSGRTQMIVATNAFGMGIDKPDIRFVVHYQMPGSIEAYYQEIGRAGRDGLPSTCVLLFNYADKNTHDFFIEGSYPDLTVIKQVYDSLAATELRRIELSTSELARRTGESNEMAVQSALYVLERAGHIQRTAPALNRGGRGAQQGRSIIMLDAVPATSLRIDPKDISRRGELERRKLRAMIDFCYTDNCYRAHILNYFGDRHHARQCGTCGNCKPRDTATSYQAELEEPRESLVAISDLSPRAITDDELLRVRKILACAKRMNGRFGKKILIGTLRGSVAKQVLTAKLNELSTYGILRDMASDELQLYIDALVDARCLRVKGGAYPTISTTELGDRVMREQERVNLALPVE